jgi:hypothetical protein
MSWEFLCEFICLDLIKYIVESFFDYCNEFLNAVWIYTIFKIISQKAACRLYKKLEWIRHFQNCGVLYTIWIPDKRHRAQSTKKKNPSP